MRGGIVSKYLLGEFVKNKRAEMGMSLREFGKKCDISHTHIDSIEKGYDFRTGKKVNITNETLKKLSDVLNVSPSYLLELSLGNDPIENDEYITIEAIGEKGGRMVKRVKKVSIEDFEMIETILNTVEKKRKLQKHIHPDI